MGMGKAAASFKNLLDANGFTTTLIQLDNVANTSFYSYDAIFVGHDTGTASGWSGSAAPLKNSGVREAGNRFGTRGSALFEVLGLYISHGNSWLSTSKTDVYVVEKTHSIWNKPYDIFSACQLDINSVLLATSHRAVYLPSPPQVSCHWDARLTTPPTIQSSKKMGVIYCGAIMQCGYPDGCGPGCVR